MKTITPIIANREKNIQSQTLSHRYPRKNSMPSFKGLPVNPTTIINAADKDIMDVFAQHYGNIGERLGLKVGKLITDSDILKNHIKSRISLESGVSQIKGKTVPRALMENAIFPFINLPLYAASWVTKQAQKIPFLKNGATKLYKSSLLRIPRKINELDAEADILKGMYDKTASVIKQFAKEKGIQLRDQDELREFARKIANGAKGEDANFIKEANEFIKENLYKASNKFFNKRTGNFNTAFERPLNRIVTGLIPVAFLANDAYNLAVLCGDSKEESKKEATDRKRQEITRVMITAYIQLLTFGAFTKQVNTIPWFTPLTSAATVLFSEIISRKRLGRPVMFLSKEKAKEMNRKEQEQEKENNNISKTETNNSKESPQKNVKPIVISYTPSPDKEPEIFTSFKANPDNKTKKSNNEEENKKSEEKKERKSLINFKTFEKAVGILITAGFALSFIKNSSYTKNSKLVKGIEKFCQTCKKKLYNPLAFKDFEITPAEFERITGSLKDVGCDSVAQGHEFIKGKYSKTVNGMIKMIKGSLSADGAETVIKSVSTSLKQAGNGLSDIEATQIEQAIKTAIQKEGVSIAERKYSNVAKKAIEILTNKNINSNNINMETVKETIIKALENNVKETPMQVERKLKPFVDIVTQPFKFISSALKLPYKIVSSLINIAVSPIEKKAANALIGKAELNKFEKAIHKAVTEVFGEKSSKVKNISQEIFTNAMEQLQKKTLPYSKAKEALEIAKRSANPDEIEKAKAKLTKATNDLMLYVNRAVEKSFNGVTQSSNKNTDLAMMSKLASSAVTSAFLVADNYNMVMLKSDGEDKEGAKEKANERIIQRLSALFYQSLFINWFNATFMSTYNSSLRGMAAVAAPNTITTEILTRKSIGMPIGRKTIEELNEIDEKNENRKGFAGKYFKFMRLLTGKKPLKDRLAKKKPENKENNENKSINTNTTSTNLLEIFANK